MTKQEIAYLATTHRFSAEQMEAVEYYQQKLEELMREE